MIVNHSKKSHKLFQNIVQKNYNLQPSGGEAICLAIVQFQIISIPPPPPPLKVFILHPLLPGNSRLPSYFASKIWTFNTPLPLGISDDFPWWVWIFSRTVHCVGKDLIKSGCQVVKNSTTQRGEHGQNSHLSSSDVSLKLRQMDQLIAKTTGFYCLKGLCELKFNFSQLCNILSIIKI